MGNQLSPEARAPEESEPPVPESSEPNIVHGTKKKKKKLRKSKNNDRSSPPVRSDDAESAQPREEDQSRPSKRKHESDPQHKKKKKKKKKHHDVNNESMNVAKVEPEQTASPQLETPQEQPRTVQIGVEKATHAKPTISGSVWDVDYPTNGELNTNGKPKKLRGSRPGGKNNLKVGFFTADEVEKVENFKINFCNMNGIGNELFNQMVQHSEREGVEWPGPHGVSKHELWTDIYSVLPDRDRRSLYRFVRRHFQMTGQKAHEWTKEQDEELVELMKQYPTKYALIGKILGRSDDDVTQRWKNRLEHRDKMNHGNWNLDETLGFMKAMQDFYAAHKELFPATTGNDIYEMDQKVIPWGSVSDSINNSRSRQQCADKWRKICKIAKAKRAQGDMAWVFDPVAAVKKTSQWKERGLSAKSEERVDDDEGDDDDDEGPVATSTPASDLKHGTAHQITEMIPKFETDTLIKPSLSSPPDVDMEDEEEPEAIYPSEPDTPAIPAAVNGLSTPSGVSTPLSVGSIQKRDPNRMALIKEKIKAANKSDPSKKRRHSEVEAEPEPAPEPEAFSPSNEQAENEARLERKRRKKEKKEKKRQRALEKQEAEQARIEAEAEAAAAETATKEAAASEKPKKHKKHRKSHDTNALVDAIPAATPDNIKKKRRKSEAGPSATVESPEASKKSKDKKKKKAHAIDKAAIKQEASL